MIFLFISKIDEESVKNNVPKQRIRSNICYLSTPGQVPLKRNVQYSKFQTNLRIYACPG